jgi:hypothetical protein
MIDLYIKHISDAINHRTLNVRIDKILPMLIHYHDFDWNIDDEIYVIHKSYKCCVCKKYVSVYTFDEFKIDDLCCDCGIAISDGGNNSEKVLYYWIIKYITIVYNDICRSILVDRLQWLKNVYTDEKA